MTTTEGTTVATLYRIRDWDEHYETTESNRRAGPLRWVLVPTKHDGKGYRRVVRDDPAVFGCWVAILQLAAKRPKGRRGVLADEDGPLTAEDIADATGMPVDLVRRSLEVLSSERVGWLIAEPPPNGCSRHAAGMQQACSTDAADILIGEEGRGGERSGGEEPASAGFAEPCEHVTATPPSEFTFPTTGKGSKTWTLPATKLAEYREAYPSLDVDVELRKARQWCRDNPAKRKTAGGMLRFLTTWLNRAQDRGGGARASPPGQMGFDGIRSFLESDREQG